MIGYGLWHKIYGSFGPQAIRGVHQLTLDVSNGRIVLEVSQAPCGGAAISTSSVSTAFTAGVCSWRRSVKKTWTGLHQDVCEDLKSGS